MRNWIKKFWRVKWMNYLMTSDHWNGVLIVFAWFNFLRLFGKKASLSFSTSFWCPRNWCWHGDRFFGKSFCGSQSFSFFFHWSCLQIMKVDFWAVFNVNWYFIPALTRQRKVSQFFFAVIWIFYWKEIINKKLKVIFCII